MQAQVFIKQSSCKHSRFRTNQHSQGHQHPQAQSFSIKHLVSGERRDQAPNKHPNWFRKACYCLGHGQ